jgi:hypothetical protein
VNRDAGARARARARTSSACIGSGIGSGMIFSAARVGMVFSGEWNGNDACTVGVVASMGVVDLTWCVYRLG